MEAYDSARQALTLLEAAGFEAWLVGGCVRDRCLGLNPHDYDIATCALPEEVMAVFSGQRVIETGLRHGTVTALLGGNPIEITTFRTDGAYSDGRHPDSVRFTRCLRDDLSRRDFTINAMAMNLRGQRYDPFGGEADLAAGVLRCVGAPEQRLTEDALRILRAMRFSSQLGCSIEPQTAAAMYRCRALLQSVSAERVFSELKKLLCGKNVRAVLLSQVQILGVVLPELLEMEGFNQQNPHHIYDVLEHTARVVEQCPPTPVLRLAALFHDAGKPASFTVDAAGVGHFYGHAEHSRTLAQAALLRLRCDNETRAAVDQLIRYHDSPIECTPKAVRRALAKLTPDGFRALMALKRADNLAQNPAYLSRQQEIDALEAMAAQQQDSCFTLHELALSGRDLLALGMSPGPQMGRILGELLSDVIADRLPNAREALLQAAKEKITQP